MGDVIEINLDVRRIRIRPGDALVVQMQRVGSVEEAKAVAEYVRNWLTAIGHAFTPVLFLDGGRSVELLTFEEAKRVVDEGEASGIAGAEAADGR